MKRTLTTLLLGILLCCNTALFSQITFSTAPLSRWSIHKGTIVLWYGEGSTVKYYAAFAVEFHDPFTEQQVVNDLKKKVFKSYKYIGYEFKQGYDCRATVAWIARELNIKIKEAEDLRIGYCTSIYKVYKEEKELVENNSLNLQDQVKIKAIVAARDKALKAAGWTLIYSDYGVDTLGMELNAQPGVAYTAIAGYDPGADSTTKAMVQVMDAGPAIPVVLSTFIQKASEGALLAEQSDFFRGSTYPKLLFAGIPLDKKQRKGGLLIYSRPVDFKRDFYQILAAAKDKFNAVRGQKGDLIAPGHYNYYGTLNLGGRKATIIENKYRSTYYIGFTISSPEGQYSLTELFKVFDVMAKEGYQSQERKKGEETIIDINKNGNTVFSVIFNKEKDELSYLFESN